MTARPDEVVAWQCALGIRVAVIDDEGEPKLTFNGSGIPPGVSLFHQDHVQKLNDYVKKMDGIIEEVGGVTASCINPYEDLKRALITQKERAISAEAALQSANARLAAITQAITDPENQPSQWGTIPLSMLPDRMDDSRDPFSEPDYQDGIARGWNNCLDKIGAPELPSYAARLAAVLALADEFDRFSKNHAIASEACKDPVNSEWHAGMSEGIADCAEAIRRAAAGEGDANEGEK